MPVLANLVHFLLALPVLALGLVVGRLYGADAGGWGALALPGIVALELPLIGGLALGLAALHAHFKDVRDLLASALTLLFFLTPILYPVSAIPLPSLVWVVRLSPATPFTLAYQSALFDGRWPARRALAPDGGDQPRRLRARRLGLRPSARDAGGGGVTPAIRVVAASKRYRRVGPGHRLRTLKSALLGSRGGVTDGAATIPALVDVSFEVAPGEAFGIVGGNGSGKSTLLKLIAGILQPTTGRVEASGRVAALIELGAGFHPEISGRENIFINGAVLGLGRREIAQRYDRIVEFAGLADFIDEPVKNYSSGMYVRLGFAVAIHTDPEILLVDEVLAVGDEAFAHKCLRRIEEMLAVGRTVVFVSHSLALVEDLCSRVLWLDRGRVRAAGEPRFVVDAYRQAVAEEEGREHREVKEARERRESAEQADVAEGDAEAAPGEVLRWGSRAAEISGRSVCSTARAPSVTTSRAARA